MRLFYAVAADEGVKAAASAAIGRLGSAARGARWVEPRDLHLTLRYLGETPSSRLPELESLMRRAARESAPFEIVYGGVGAFESLEDPRVIWIGLDAGLGPMERLAGLLGYDEPRPYAPHLTLGRRRREPPSAAFQAALRAEPSLALRQAVDRISLYASRPAPSGRVYEVLSEAPLGG